MKPLVIDATATSAIAVCRVPGCPWRHCTSHREAARRAAIEHQRSVHPDVRATARDALYQARYRSKKSQKPSA